MTGERGECQLFHYVIAPGGMPGSNDTKSSSPSNNSAVHILGGVFIATHKSSGVVSIPTECPYAPLLLLSQYSIVETSDLWQAISTFALLCGLLESSETIT